MGRKRSIFFRIGDINISLQSDLPWSERALSQKFDKFKVHNPKNAQIRIRHHFGLPKIKEKNLGKEVYRRNPWAIYRKADRWLYLGILPDKLPAYHKLIIANDNYSQIDIYNPSSGILSAGRHHSLAFIPTDQIFISQFLANNQGFYLHAGGVNFLKKGLLFVGHSGAGKTTMVRLFSKVAEILCDDRMIVRRVNQKFKIFGTWSHGMEPQVSSASADLAAIFFLKKGKISKAVRIDDPFEIEGRLLPCIIRPYVDARWWKNIFAVLNNLYSKVPCFLLHFKKDTSVRAVIRDVLEEESG